MAAGKRPVPFRTRKLSPPAPMVLPPGGSGRVGYRRPNNFTQSTRYTTPPLRSGCFTMSGLCVDAQGSVGSVPGPHSALRTTTHAPTMGAHQRKPASRARLRIADNHPCTNNRCTPTDHVLGELANVDTHEFPPWRMASGNGRIVNFDENHPHIDRQARRTPHCEQLSLHPSLVHANENPVTGRTPHCGQPHHHPSLVHTNENPVPGPHSALRTTAPAPTMGSHQRKPGDGPHSASRYGWW